MYNNVFFICFVKEKRKDNNRPASQSMQVQ